MKGRVINIVMMNSSVDGVFCVGRVVVKVLLAVVEVEARAGKYSCARGSAESDACACIVCGNFLGNLITSSWVSCLYFAIFERKCHG